MCADKRSVIEYYDSKASRWDYENPIRPEVAEKILALSDIRPGMTVLDVACGTGLMFTGLLNRDPKMIVGVDASGAMLAEARSKLGGDKRVTLIRADFHALHFDEPFDRCVIYNALHHFADHNQLLRRAAGAVKPGGRLTVAMTDSKATVDAKMKALPPELSTPLPEAKALAALLSPWFTIDACISDDEKYVVSGIRTDTPARSVFFPKDRR